MKLSLQIICMTMMLLLISCTSDADIGQKTITESELAKLSGREIIDELEKNGKVLPIVYEDDAAQEEAVKTIIEDINTGNVGDGVYPYNYSGMVELAKAMESIIEEMQ